MSLEPPRKIRNRMDHSGLYMTKKKKCKKQKCSNWKGGRCICRK